jgi:hypothetical protein
MFTTPSAARRRALRAVPALAVLAATLPGGGAHAFDLSIPKLEDLRPKWDAVGLGDTADEVIQRMGSPNGRTEVQTMGLAQLTLEWKDVRGWHYTARFLAGRLYAKEMTDSR